MALHSCLCLGREVRKDTTGKEIVAYSHAVPHGLGQISREGFRSVPSGHHEDLRPGEGFWAAHQSSLHPACA